MTNLHNALLLKQLYQLKQLGYRYTDLSIPAKKKREVDIESINNLNILREDRENCSLCELSKTRLRVVSGEGNGDADVMFISTTPNSLQEDNNSLFIGKSGELLANMIERVLLIPKSDIYLTNLVKCRPSNNTPITPTEAHSCLPYLQREIELVKPKIIVTLGIEAYNYLTGENRDIDEVRGKSIRKKSYIILPTFNINYLLRNPSAKRYAFEDMKLIKYLMEK